MGIGAEKRPELAREIAGSATRIAQELSGPRWKRGVIQEAGVSAAVYASLAAKFTALTSLVRAAALESGDQAVVDLTESVLGMGERIVPDNGDWEKMARGGTDVDSITPSKESRDLGKLRRILDSNVHPRPSENYFGSEPVGR